jgi:hypothetical protein
MNRQAFVIVDRLRHLAIAQAMGVAVGGLIAIGPAQAASDGAFHTSSGNIVCSQNTDNVECVIKSGLKPAPAKKKCDAGDPVSDRVILSAAGTAEAIDCAGDPGPLVDEKVAKELPEGSTMIRGEIGCAAYKFGLVCVNNKGRGFFLSRASSRVF